MNRLQKCEKPQFFGIFVQNGKFWTVFCQNGQNWNFFQKISWNIFVALTNPNWMKRTDVIPSRDHKTHFKVLVWFLSHAAQKIREVRISYFRLAKCIFLLENMSLEWNNRWNMVNVVNFFFQAFMSKNGPKWAFFRCLGPQICVFKAFYI